MAHPIDNPGGSILIDTGEQITSVELNRVGTMAAQSFFHWLARMMQDDDGDPLAGFFADDCKVTISGLTATIAAGCGLIYDTTATATYGLSYRPIVLSVSTTQAVNAHHATLPRWDLICIKANTSDDTNLTKNVKNLTAGTWSSPTLASRRRWGYSVQYVAGTAASTPTDPSTPSGYIPIARLRVPATSGAITVDDLRPILQWSLDLPTDLGTDYASSFVPGTSTECQVSASSPASMVLQVAAGTPVVNGRRRRVGYQKVTVSTAHATNNRNDYVVVNQDGTVEVLAGADDGTEAPPAVAADQLALYQVYVAATDTTLDSSTLTDLRERRPFIGYDVIRDGTVRAAQLVEDARPVRLVWETPGAETTNYREVSFTTVDADNNLAGNTDFLVRVLSSSLDAVAAADWELSETGTGSATIASTGTAFVVQSDANGEGTIRLLDQTSAFVGTVYLFAEPLNKPGTKTYVAMSYT